MVQEANLWEGLAGGFGWLPIPQMSVVKTDVATAMQMMEDHGGPAPMLCCSDTPGFFERGISRVTNSWSQHAALFVGKRNGQMIRAKHPDLLKARELQGDNWQGHILPPVPASTNDFEVIESQALINTNTLPNFTGEGRQMVAFLRDWTDSEIDAVLYKAYSMYGAPYNLFDIAKYLFPLVPNPHFIKVCSTYVECAVSERDAYMTDWLRAGGVDPDQCSPGDVGRYFFSNTKYTPVLFRCNLREAKTKI
jgi:hypothetical protein